MLATWLIAALIVCALLMLVGWAYDRIAGPAEVETSCPLFPTPPRRARPQRAS